MIAYHDGDGVLIDLTKVIKDADQIIYDDSQTMIGATNVQEAIEKLNEYFANTFPGWVRHRGQEGVA